MGAVQAFLFFALEVVGAVSAVALVTALWAFLFFVINEEANNIKNSTYEENHQ